MSEPCTTCRGKGTIHVKHGTPFETDSIEEHAGAWHTVVCPTCKGISSQRKADFLRGARAMRDAAVKEVAEGSWDSAISTLRTMKRSAAIAVSCLPDPEYTEEGQ